MANVLILGATGTYGKQIAGYLKSIDEVDTIGLIARNARPLAKLTADIGKKAVPVTLDISNIAALKTSLGEYDYVCNVTGHYSDLLESVLLAAIESETSYLDISEGWKEAEIAFSYHDKAISNNVICIHGIGSTPGITNLLAKYAIRDLNEIKSLHCGFFTAGSTYLPDSSELIKQKLDNKVSSRDRTVIEVASGEIKIVLNGSLVLRPAMEDEVTIRYLNRNELTVYPINMSFPVTMNKYAEPAENMSACLAFFPDEINKSLKRYAGEYTSGNSNMVDTIFSFFDHIVDLVDAGSGNEDLPVYAQWAYVAGTTQGRHIGRICTPGKPLSIAAALTTALCGMIKDNNQKPGVYAPEDIYDPVTFLSDVHHLQYGQSDFSLREETYTDEQVKQS